MFIMTSIEKVLLIINASANFIYYCFSGREFRNRFCRIVCCDFSNLFRRCRYADSPGVVGGTFHTVVMAYTPNDRRESSIDSQTVFMDVAGFKSDFEMTSLARGRECMGSLFPVTPSSVQSDVISHEEEYVAKSRRVSPETLNKGQDIASEALVSDCQEG